jgi:methanogenic corrinoid protein MtbC1
MREEGGAMQDLRGDAGLALAAAVARPRFRPTALSSRRRARLERFVEAEILPVLLGAHPAAAPPRESPTVAQEALLHALLAVDSEAAATFERVWTTRLSDARLMLDVLAPAARRLGEMWEEDSCDFFAVTQAVGRLQSLLARLQLRQQPRRRADPTMLLLTAPDETHAFGADMAAELFRREGWRVERGDASRLDRLAERHFDALGVSCGCDRAYAALPDFLKAARALAHPDRLAIVVGGALFSASPALAGELGADFAATDMEATRRISLALLQRQQL